MTHILSLYHTHILSLYDTQGKSDHLSLMNVFEGWLTEKAKGFKAGRAFAQQLFLKESVLDTILSTTEQVHPVHATRACDPVHVTPCM